MPDNIEKAILVAIKSQTAAQEDFSTWIDELTALTEAAGFLPVVQVIQNRERVQSSTYVGKGKLQEIKNLVEELEPSAVVFDNELTPVQVRNLETALEVPIVDRTMLILKIFAQRARSREGILQVELARMEYMLPRLTGLGAGMSRTGAGIAPGGLVNKSLNWTAAG
ncbi:hypothetical protein [Syntrophomonas palmitatica]|uniref:HflX-like GTP-binding protein n=1 Tax=Syntrophomonas palmitatica TaxID=402877 RepID=UPI0006D292C6